MLGTLEGRVGRAERDFPAREKTPGVVGTVRKEVERVEEALIKVLGGI